MDTLCGLFGYSKQAFYKKQKGIFKSSADETLVLDSVIRIRRDMPRIGTRKLQVLLAKEGFRMGRDSLFALLERNSLLVRRRRTKVRTTQSSHWLRKYPNLIRGLTVLKANRLWVSDITYVRTEMGFLYLFLITDAYSRRIMGYATSINMEAENAVAALRMALRTLNGVKLKNLIHHSDRGVQYCSGAYVKVLQKWSVKISMTENGDPLENAIAERVNGILKTEWIYDQKFDTFEQGRKYISKIIRIYNSKRPHSSVEMMTPDEAHSKSGILKRKWKNYYTPTST